MRATLLLFVPALLCIASGCSNAHEADVDGGYLPLGDGWVVDSSVEWCGSVQCGAGTTCCNASCGICTPPGTGCIDLYCGDGDAGPAPDTGPIARVCGGLVARECDPGEYCDFPDASFCGGDDEEGVCRPRPTSCPDPGGNRVCGCDGQDYVGDCSAYLAGTDIAHQGSCEMPPPPSSEASATQSCGPTDGPAWVFIITSGAPVCGAATVASLTIEIDDDVLGGTETFAIGGSAGNSATACPYGVGGPPCFPLTGSVTFSGFHANVGAVFSYALSAYDGTAYESTNVSVGTWCPGTRLCG